VTQLANAGRRLKPVDASGRHRLTCQPSSRTGENPPYGMIGGTVETSASFEARYAPLSYPTEGGDVSGATVDLNAHEAGNGG
jgi:hypothetical protein